MSDKHIEKSFLYLLVFSILLHTALFALLILAPQGKKVGKQEPYMVELQEAPQGKQAPAGLEKEVKKRLGEQRRRVQKEIAPKGEMERDKIAPGPPRWQAPQPEEEMKRDRTAALPKPAPRTGPIPRPAQRGGDMAVPRQYDQGRAPMKEAPHGEEPPISRKRKTPDIARLLPGADKMAKLEESYRKKYGPEVEEGDAKFLNTEDFLFGSFLRRFETAVYGVWRYPTEAVKMGIEGVTPVKIVFNRRGEVEKVEILESSGSKILDNEVLRTLRYLGPIGSFPKSYERENFNLIAFFHYGIISGTSRGTLH